jgi:hypothetical protein
MTFEITVRPTGRFEKFEGIECRIWEGTTPKGTKVEFMVPLVRAAKDADNSELEAALQEIKAERQLVAFDTRML